MRRRGSSRLRTQPGDEGFHVLAPVNACLSVDCKRSSFVSVGTSVKWTRFGNLLARTTHARPEL